MQKRVLHKPKGCLLKIEPCDDNVGQVSKAMDLILPDGRKLTKEIIDQMDFSSDSAEIEEKIEVVPCVNSVNEEIKAEVEDEHFEENNIKEEDSVKLSSEELKNLENDSISCLSQEDNILETFVFAPPSKTVPKIIRYTIEFILSVEKREEINLNMDKSILKKPESNVQRFRIEMNRIAWVNVEDVVRIVRNSKLNRAEMGKCAEILFEKAISEDNFCILYAAFINRLRGFCFLNETINSEGDSYFFTSIIEMCWNVIEKRQSWSDFEKEMVDKSKLKNEKESENALIDANKIKDRIFGTLRFLVIMIVNKIIKPIILKELIEKVMKNTEDEEAELLVFVLTDVVSEFYLLDKDLFVSVQNFLAEIIKVTKETRIKFLVMDAVDKMKEAEKGKVIKSKYFDTKVTDISKESEIQAPESGRFRRGTKFNNENIDKNKSVNNITTKMGNLDIKSKFSTNNNRINSKLPNFKPVKTRNEPFKLQNTFDVLKNQEIKITDADLDYCKSIVNELAYYKEEDREEAIRDVNQEIRHNKITKAAFTAGIISMGVKSDNFDDFIVFFIYAAKQLSIEPKTMYNSILYTKDMMEDLIIDFPFVKNRYESFCNTVRKRGLIDNNQFEKLQIDTKSNGDVGNNNYIRTDENNDK